MNETVSASGRVQCAGLSIDESLDAFVRQEILRGLGMDGDGFWISLASILSELAPRNRELLEKRDQFQSSIDAWHLERKGQSHNAENYRSFLNSIGYLVPQGEVFQISTENVDPEISKIAGPQLVVPLSNARYALNAANARWGSLLDAVYGTDVIPETEGVTRDDPYDPRRGGKVFEFSQRILDESVPLSEGSYAKVAEFKVIDHCISLTLQDGSRTGLKEPGQFAGWNGDPERPQSILFKKNELHVEILLDREHPVGRDHPAGICDILLESAVTTIQDLEDSVATVDAQDKVNVYRNLLGLMKGDLVAHFEKDGRKTMRNLNPDRSYRSVENGELVLPGRSLMLVRNVGLLIYTDAVLDGQGNEIPEGILDGILTAAMGLYDLRGLGRFRNSRTGSIYIVKPKLHGPEEVAFSVELFRMIEEALLMEPNTLKIGIMDEERRTTVNLQECIRSARERVIFINTGFLDRTGDEIHTSMHAGPMVRKTDMKVQKWIKAYEDWNVDVGLACGFHGKAQIGKGMWAMPDQMEDMLQTKIGHPMAGANCAWVPSPTAATLHGVHYHRVNVMERQKELKGRRETSLDDILYPPLAPDINWSEDEIRRELDNNCQGILGYVVRWVNQGVGCSKVLDINDVGLMEDRATLRISSQMLANWLQHQVVSREQVMESLKRMAIVVDRQNEGDPEYSPMSPDFRGIAFQAACDLVFNSTEVPNGYTELTLHARRRELKGITSVS